MSDCLFCSIAEGEMEAGIIYEDERVVAFADVNPQAPVHYLIIPRRHIASVNEIEENDEGLIGHLYTVARRVAEEEGVADSGYRLVVNCGDDAGQEVMHLHLHLLGGRKLQWPPG
ncbi:MAG: histidine triad nucleotide-binding protein [bacterium]